MFCVSPKARLFKKGVFLFKTKNACGRLFSRKHGLGRPKRAFSKKARLKQQTHKKMVAA